jgi:hypothetical protein
MKSMERSKSQKILMRSDGARCENANKFNRQMLCTYHHIVDKQGRLAARDREESTKRQTSKTIALGTLALVIGLCNPWQSPRQETKLNLFRQGSHWGISDGRTECQDNAGA